MMGEAGCRRFRPAADTKPADIRIGVSGNTEARDTLSFFHSGLLHIFTREREKPLQKNRKQIVWVI